MIRRLVVLALLVGGALLLEPLRVPTAGVIAPRSLFLFGILLLTADTFGALARDFRVPAMVGYIVAGVVLGPALLGVVPGEVLDDLATMQSLAVGLIGLLAGVELRLHDLRERWRAVVAILAFQTLFVLVFVVGAVLVGRPWIPFGAGLGLGPLLLLALLFATMLAVNSPMATLALLTETRAAGPVARTTLGVVLLVDVAVVVLFTIVVSVAQATLSGTDLGVWDVLSRLLLEVSGSIIAGVLVGVLLSLYLRFVKGELVLFAVIVVFAVLAAAEALHFEVLLSLIVAGFLVENVAPVRAEPLVEALEVIAGPVFVVFFALAGAGLPLGDFAGLWPVVLALVLIRGWAVYLGSRIGARYVGAEEVVRRYAWTGLVAQAGVALGLAALVAQRFPQLAVGMQALTVGIIAVNQSVGPILFRRGLERAGEIREA